MSVKLRSKKSQGGNKSLYLDIYLYGKRSYKFLGLYLTRNKTDNAKVLELANKLRIQTELEIQSKRYGISSPRDDQDIQSFGTEVASKKNPTNKKLYTLMLKHLEVLGGKASPIQSITPSLSEEFKEHLLRSMKASSASCFYGKFKSLLRLAVRNEIIGRNPAEGFTIKCQEPPLKYLTLQEVKILTSTPCSNQQVRNAFLFGVLTGLRWGDISRLLWSDISSGLVLIKQQKVQRMVTIPLSKYALSLLELQRDTPISSWQKTSKYLPEQIFKFPTSNIVQRTLKGWAKSAGIGKSISPHWSRHTFATIMLNSGADVHVISNLMGHADLGMTLRYAKLLNPRKQQVIDQFPSIDDDQFPAQPRSVLPSKI